MSESISLSAGVARRYATAIFNLCDEQDQLKILQKEVELLSELLKKSSDFQSLITSPVYSREQQEMVVVSLAKYLKVGANTKNLLRLLAKKGRLFILKDFIDEVLILLSNKRDEIGAEVVSAGTLTITQIAKLETSFSEILKKDVKIEVKIDKSLIGGMIVKLGSKMIDTTIKSKLVKLQTKMKEVN